MGAAALQKYIGSLGGIGTSGVGSSSSYSPKELNKEVMPEKVHLLSVSFLFWLSVYRNGSFLQRPFPWHLPILFILLFC